MALLGLSLLLASVVYVVIRPPSWLPPWLLPWNGFGGVLGNAAAQRQQPPRLPPKHGEQDQIPVKQLAEPSSDDSALTTSSESRDTMLMPPPPPPPPPPSTIQIPSITEPDAASEEQTTPKATATTPSLCVPTFSLSGDSSPSNNAANNTSIMPPPPAPRAQPQTGRLPAFPAMNSIQRARGPVPNRGPPSSSSSSSGLAPPPTHSSKPSKPSRKVLLSPGHSPLDWARISGPNADLRGVPPSTPFLRVPPSLLKKQNGRKGQDAWMALNGKVYNVTPYAKYHPGGVPELMRGAGRDGTKLFGEVHPWVNYETMLTACMVGILVEEPEANASEMDKMD